MRYLWFLLIVPTLAGCAMDDEYDHVPTYAAPVANACSGASHPGSPMYSSFAPQTQEPPR